MISTLRGNTDRLYTSEMAPKIVRRTKQLVVGAGALTATMVGGYIYCTGSGMLKMTSIWKPYCRQPPTKTGAASAAGRRASPTRRPRRRTRRPRRRTRHPRPRGRTRHPRLYVSVWH